MKRPSIVGHYTSDLVYYRLAPAVFDELRKKNPRDSKGWRRHKHFQWLTEDIGYPKIREHLAAVIALMKASNRWVEFYRAMQRVFPKYEEQMLLLLLNGNEKH